MQIRIRKIAENLALCLPSSASLSFSSSVRKVALGGGGAGAFPCTPPPGNGLRAWDKIQLYSLLPDDHGIYHKWKMILVRNGLRTMKRSVLLIRIGSGRICIIFADPRSASRACRSGPYRFQPNLKPYKTAWESVLSICVCFHKDLYKSDLRQL